MLQNGWCTCICRCNECQSECNIRKTEKDVRDSHVRNVIRVFILWVRPIMADFE